MQVEQDKIQQKMQEFLKENNLLQSRMDKMLEEEKNAKARIADATRQAEDIKKAASLEYSLVLKSLMNFNEKFSRVTSENSNKTSEIMSLLSKFLQEIGKTSPKDIVEKIDKAVSPKTENMADEDGEPIVEFDLDEAINPKKDLDLKALCVELGVYRG